MAEGGIILNIDKPGDRNQFRVRKYSRNGSVSQRGDSEVRIDEEDEALKLEKLKQSIESEDEATPNKPVRSVDRGQKASRFSQHDVM
jgi:hypothetical protein